MTLRDIDISNIPSSISLLKNLKNLLIYNCKKLETIPDQIGDLNSMYFLSISECESLGSIPDTIGNLSSLRSLVIDDNRTLTTLPDTIGRLENLELLTLTGTPLRDLPIEELKSLPLLIHIGYDNKTLQNLTDEEKEFLESVQ